MRAHFDVISSALEIKRTASPKFMEEKPGVSEGMVFVYFFLNHCFNVVYRTQRSCIRTKTSCSL